MTPYTRFHGRTRISQMHAMFKQIYTFPVAMHPVYDIVYAQRGILAWGTTSSQRGRGRNGTLCVLTTTSCGISNTRYVYALEPKPAFSSQPT